MVKNSTAILLSLPATFWRLATSTVTFVYLSLCWCLDLGIGSILAYKKDPEFWVKMENTIYVPALPVVEVNPPQIFLEIHQIG